MCTRMWNISNIYIAFETAHVYYSSGWATGKVQYNDKQLGLKVVYKDDGQEDFLKESDIDGKEVILKL